jgi:hypothetical protein
MSEWQDIAKLKRDGRQVLFFSPAGHFVAPASEEFSDAEARKMHLEIYQETGSWPNHRFSPTHFAELTIPALTPKDTP